MVSSQISTMMSSYPDNTGAVMSVKSTDTSDFGDIMSQSLAKSSKDQTAYKNTAVTGSMQAQSGQAKSYDAANNRDTVKSSDSRQTSDKVSTSDKSAAGDKTGSQQVSDASDTAGKTDAKDKTSVAVSSIKDEIKSKLDVTEEDIENALSNLGFTMADLLDDTNLTDFVVELTGMESSLEILTDADMNAALEELTQTIDDITAGLVEDLGISEQELDSLITEVSTRDGALQTQTDNKGAIVEKSLDNDRLQKNVNTSDNAPDVQNSAQDAVTVKVYDKSDEAGFDDDEAGSRPSAKDDRQVSTRSDFADTAGSIIDNLNEAVEEAVNNGEMQEIVDPSRIMQQIVDNARVTLSQNTTSMELMLNPENLGKVNLNVSVKEGVVTATLTAQNELVKSAIENQLVMLKENLNNQGLKVEAVEVTVESHAFEAGTEFNQNSGYDEARGQAQKGSRPLRLDSLDDLDIDALTDDERIVVDMMQKEGNQVNFTA